MTGFNIDEFRSRVTPPLRNNKFLVRLEMLPPALKGLELESTFPDLQFYAEMVDLPGVQLMTMEHRRYGYGAVERKPYQPMYPDCRLVLRSDQGGGVFRFMRAWQACAVNYPFFPEGISAPTGQVSGATRSSPVAPSRAEATPYEVGYKRQYAVPVVIYVYGDGGELAEKVVMRDAYPVGVGDTPLSWGVNNTYAQLPVNLAFSQYYFVRLGDQNRRSGD